AGATWPADARRKGGPAPRSPCPDRVSDPRWRCVLEHHDVLTRINFRTDAGPCATIRRRLREDKLLRVSKWTDAGLIGLAAGLGTLFFLDAQRTPDGPWTLLDLGVGV